MKRVSCEFHLKFLREFHMNFTWNLFHVNLYTKTSYAVYPWELWDWLSWRRMHTTSCEFQFGSWHVTSVWSWHVSVILSQIGLNQCVWLPEYNDYLWNMHVSIKFLSYLQQTQSCQEGNFVMSSYYPHINNTREERRNVLQKQGVEEEWLLFTWFSKPV